jgi:hypothetical protein
VIPAFRTQFDGSFSPAKYAALLDLLESRCGVKTGFRVAETPVFVPLESLHGMALAGAELTRNLLVDQAYLAAATAAIPNGYRVGGKTSHPNFLTADFALVEDSRAGLVPRLVEIQAFPSVFAFQAVLCGAYRSAFSLAPELGCYLSGLTEKSYWDLFARTILGGHHPGGVILSEIDPLNQKTRPDFEVTANRLGIEIVDITRIYAIGNVLHYRAPNGQATPIRRIYNRAIADELIARNIHLGFDLAHEWDVEWAGHPNWYFLISKFSIPWLSRPPVAHPMVPPAVFLDEFLNGPGRAQFETQGVPLPPGAGPDTVYAELLLKPLFSFAGKGIQFEPTQAQLEAIPASQRKNYLLQQRMRFVPTIQTPAGPTQAEFRILYLWPDGGDLTPALSLVRLGRGKMMGVDHNRNQDWVGASAAFYPPAQHAP